MYRIGVRHRFSAAHSLPGHRGKCSRLHGHSWTVEVVLAAAENSAGGLIFDFDDAREALEDILEPYDHSCLNEVGPFDSVPPTAENVARLVFDRMSDRARDERWPVEVDSATVWESGETWASFSE